MNGGVYNPPTVIKGATDAEGREVVDRRDAAGRVISAKSSAQVRDLMQAVVDSDNGQRNLKLDATPVAARPAPRSGPTPAAVAIKGYVTSFVGFAPVDDPQILTYVVVTNPRAGRYRNEHRRAGRTRT